MPRFVAVVLLPTVLPAGFVHAQTWVALAPSPAPSVRSYSALAHDSARHLTMLFGGYNGTATPLGDSWSFDGTSWSQLGGAAPPARWGHGMVYDTRRERLVLFGGFQPSPGNPLPDAIGLDDTWENTGFGWIQVATAVRPSPRGYAGIAYDPVRQRTVLFGGAGPNATYLQDTWEWNGTAWNAVATPSRPQIRRAPAMAYDIERQQVALFGGGALGTQFGDTWTYDGATWTQRLPAASPPARWEATLAYDPACGTLLLHGGTTFGYQTVFGDTWSWNGTTWSSVGGAQPPPRHGASSTFDLQNGRTLLIGGRNGAGFRSDLWSRASSCARSMSTLLPAVAGQAAQYRYNYPSTAAGNLFVELVTLRNPNAFAVPLPGFVSVGLARVDLFFILLQNLGILLPGGIQDTALLQVPNSTAIVGFTFDVQDLDIDPSTSFVSWAGNDIEATVAAAPPPVASFNASPPSGLAPLTVQFTDTSTNAPTAWQWDLDGDTIVDSTQQNPVFTYVTPYTYTARLVASSQWGQSSHQQQILVGTPPPVAAFTANPLSGTAPLTVQFTNTSTLSFGWQWDFDNDGVIDSTSFNPTWTYQSPGIYSVRLVATGAGGSNTLVQPGLITAFQPPRFTGTPLAGPAPLQVAFTDTSTISPTSWQWDFQNDGIIDSTLQNPTFTYLANGYYTVRLVVGTASGPRALVKTSYVLVGPPPNAGLDLALIQPGTFQMGSPFGIEAPVHQVTLSRPFWIGRREITQAQYQAVIGTNPSFFQGASWPNSQVRPVEQVQRSHALAYCAALQAAESAAGRQPPPGYQYRLPTEAEWEFCCRAGTATAYSFGQVLGCGNANYWFDNNLAVYCCSAACQTTPVGSFPANPFGLFDMHGNVAEWVLDQSDGTANYPSGPVTDPYVGGGPFRFPFYRGGNYVSDDDKCRSAYRGSTAGHFGFRIVLAPELPW